MSPGAADTSEGVKTRDLLTVGEPTTMVIILEKGAADAPALAEGVDEAAVFEAAVPAAVPLTDFMGPLAISMPSLMPSADCGDPGEISKDLFARAKDCMQKHVLGGILGDYPPTI